MTFSVQFLDAAWPLSRSFWLTERGWLAMCLKAANNNGNGGK